MMILVGAKFGSRHRSTVSDKKPVSLEQRELKANSKAEVKLTEL